MEWFEKDAVEIEKDIELPQFDLLDVSPTRCDAQKYKTGKIGIALYLYISMLFLLLALSEQWGAREREKKKKERGERRLFCCSSSLINCEPWWFI